MARNLPLTRLRALLHRRMRYHVTAGGGLFLLTVFLTGLGAFLSGNNLLFLIFAASLALLLVSGFLSRLVLAGLELELQLPEHISARAPIPASILVRNLKRITPSFSLELSGQRDAASGTPAILTGPVYIPLLPGRATIQTAVELVFPRRGRHHENLFLISTKFPFGFIRKTTTVALRRETIVYPCIDDPQPQIDLLLDTVSAELAARSQGAGREFYSLRPYQSLDDARHVDWKSTAHTGSLQVRESARSERRAVEIHFDRRIAPAGEAAFEDLVEQCASFTWNLSLRHADLSFTSQEFNPDLTTDLLAASGVYDILVFLSLVEPIVTGDLNTSLLPDSSFMSNDGNVRIIFSAHLGDSHPDSHVIGPRKSRGLKPAAEH